MSLSYICLYLICENISRFNRAFLEKKLDLIVLRRFYSYEVIEILMKKGQNRKRVRKFLNKEYFALLINEHLKTLEFKYFRPQDLSIILEMMPKIGDTLEKVSFKFQGRFGPYEEETYVKKILLHLKNVKVINIKCFSKCHDSILEVIYSSCKKLEVLYLPNCPITSAGLKSLCPEDRKDNTFNLRLLSLPGIRDCDEGVAHLLKNLPSLERIIYDDLVDVVHKLHVSDLRNNTLHIIPKYNLTSLDLHKVYYFERNTGLLEETLAIAAELCPHVSIGVSVIETEKESLILSRFPDIRHISISGHRTSLDVGDFLLHSGKTIRQMNLTSLKLNLSILVENCPNLEYLNLDHIEYYIPEKAKCGNTLKSMRELTLIKIDEDEEKTKTVLKLLLDSCPNLADIFFADISCQEQLTSDVIQKYCEKSQTLEKLVFMYCNIEDALLEQIPLTCTSLKELVIDCCHNIGSHDFEHLRDIIRDNNSGVEVVFYESDF